MKNFLEKNYKVIVFIILAFVFAVSVLNAANDSAIFDETAHIPAGYSYLTQHQIRLNPEHPPLIKDLAALPLLAIHPKFDTSQPFWTTEINGQWDAGKSFLWHSGNNPDQIIFWARLPIVLLTIGFGLFLFFWVKKSYGLLAGLFSLTLFAFDPNILGHDHFVTTDLGIAGFMLVAFYFYFKFIKNPTWKNVWLAGFFLALMQLSKFSAPVAFPVLGLATIIYPFVKLPREKVKSMFKYRWKTFGEYVGKAAVAVLFSLVVVWALYAINTYALPKDKLADTINYYFSASDTNVKAQLTNKVLIAMDHNTILRPLSEYFLGIAMVFKRVEGGNGAYFMGQVSSNGFRSYFPTVFAIKEPLPNLFFMAFALVFALGSIIIAFFKNFKNLFKKEYAYISHYLRTNITEFSMFVFIALYAYLAITGNLDIGFRHLFPILPFAYILTTKQVFDFLKRLKSEHMKAVFYSVIGILLALLVIETIAVYPSYMSYFNELAGGPKNGYRYVTDSNADWGQDLKRLKNFLNDHPEIQKIRVDYFGGADISYYIGSKYEMWWDSKRPVEAGWYAISTNFLQGSLYDKTKKDGDSYRWITTLGKKPAYQVGTSILIYNVTRQDLNNIAKNNIP